MTKLKDFRLEKGISAQKLADIIGTNARTIFRWEAEQSEMTHGNLIKLADYFGCTTDELLGREPIDVKNQNVGITPLENKLLQAFRKLEPIDQNRVVGIVQSFVV